MSVQDPGEPTAEKKPYTEDAPERRVAVIDIGSNSARAVVYERDPTGQLRILASTRASLRLVREVDRGGRLSDEAVERVMEALADFRAIALGAGAGRILAVATAAMRDAQNGPALIERVRRELGFGVEVIDGEREAHYGFLGGVRGLAVEHGLLFDLGGGSMQVSRFRDRDRARAWSLPLGALRLSNAFLEEDPPSAGEVRRLKKHVRTVLEEAGVPALKARETLVGTGGTVRNLAKIDRKARGYPISRVHGYVLARAHVHEIAAQLAERPARKRESIPGLSAERGDSIVGGALAIETLMEIVEAPEIQVSGQGVREGLAYSLFSERPPSPREVRQASIASLTSRFAGWNAAAADRRAALARALLEVLVPRADPELEEALDYAARVLDIGRSVDFFDRHEHVADIVIATELNGFSHREVALLAAIVRTARDEQAPKMYSPLLGKDDRSSIGQAGVLLALADDIEERCPPGAPVEIECRLERSQAVVIVPALAGWRPRGLGARFERAFGRQVTVRR